MTDEIIQKLADDAKKEISEAFMKAVFLKLMERLDDEGRENYVKMAEEGATSDKLEVFLREKIKNYDEVVQEAVKVFEEEKEE